MKNIFKILSYFLIIIIILFILAANSKIFKNFIKDNFFQTKKIQQLSSNINRLEKINKNTEKILKRYKADGIYQINQFALSHDVKFKRDLRNLELNIYKKNNIKSNQSIINGTIEIFSSQEPLLRGIKDFFPASSFIEFSNNNIYFLSSIGITAYGKINKNKLILKQIENNLDEFLGKKQFERFLKISVSEKKDKKNTNWFSYKDIKIIDGIVYLSYIHELEKNCWTPAIVSAKLNHNFLEFKQLFIIESCIHEDNNIDKSFSANQTGGRIEQLNDNEIIFTTGEFRERYLAQQENIFGKIISINLENKNYKILSKGHRNPQGIVYDKKNNLIIASEHGPQSGDEINIIDLKEEKIPNFGWPKASYGNHYQDKDNIKYPLLKSHKKNNFEEPSYYFKRAGIGSAQIININNFYLLSSLKAKTIFIFKLDVEKKKLILEDEIFIGERIRDIIKISNNEILLYLEDTASIAKLDIKSLN